MKETRFKDTEVGRIPEDWEVGTLFELCSKITDGSHESPKETKIGYCMPSVKDMTMQSFNFIDCKVISENDYRKLVNNGCQPLKGDVLIAKDGSILKYSFALKEDLQIVILSSIAIIRPIQNLVNSEYLAIYFRQPKFIEKVLADYKTGTGVPRIVLKNFAKIKITRPSSIEEQERIATALSKVDALISELGKLIEKKRAIKQGAMQQLLTGKKRLKGFDEPWVETTLGDNILFLRTGLNPRVHFKLNTPDADCFYITVRELQDFDIIIDEQTDRINRLAVGRIDERSKLKAGDILFSGTGTIGQTALVKDKPDNWGIKEGIYAITPNCKTLDSSFLIYYLHTSEAISLFSSMSSGSTINSVPMAKLTELSMQLPSLSEQSAIVSVLTAIDNEISAIEAKKAKYEQIKQGMMQQLLTGKIRLVETTVKTNATSANVHFRRSVLAAEIAERLYEEPTFGHVKMEKMLFLTERLCHIDIGSNYHRDAAGPYDNRALRSIDSQLKKQKWFEVRRTEKGNRYVPMQNRGKHKSYFDKYFSAVLPTFDKIINTFKTERTEKCEIVATLYSAWEDLLHSNKPFTDADIVNEVLNNWHESKKRISKERWLSAIQWMRENGFAPDYKNN